MIRYILDTCVCSYLIKCTPKISETIQHHIIAHSSGRMCITIFNHAELFTGVKLKESSKLQKAIEDFVERLEIIPFDEEASYKYAEIRSSLQKSGKIIDDMDMLIAACALSAQAVLITNNEKHFEHIPNLKIEDWTK